MVAGDTPGNFANVRFNNPGAQYPAHGENAAAFGQQGHAVIGGGHKIAQFPTPVHGAAANMDLLDRNYTGMPIREAARKWSGGSRDSVPGFAGDTVITKEMMRDPAFAVPFVQAIARGEAPGRYPMSDEQWTQAHGMFTGIRGGAAPSPTPPVDPRNRLTQAMLEQGGMPPMQTAALTPAGGGPPPPVAMPPAATAQAPVAPNPPTMTDIRPMGTIPGPLTPPTAVEPPPSLGRTPTMAPEFVVDPVAPKMPPIHDYEIRGWNMLRAARGDPTITAIGTKLIEDGKKLRLDEHARDVTVYNARVAANEQERAAIRAANRKAALPETELALRTGEAELAEKERSRREQMQFGPGGKAEVLKSVVKSYADTQSLPRAAQAAAEAQDLLERGIYTGADATIKTFAQKAGGVLGMPPDPKVANTENFKAAVLLMIGSLRKDIAGTGGQNPAELEALLKAVAGDNRLEKDAIKAILDRHQEANISDAVAHQKRLLAYVGNDPDARRVDYPQYTLPMERIVPRAAIETLRQRHGKKGDAALEEFNDEFQTPGLAQRLLRLRR